MRTPNFLLAIFLFLVVVLASFFYFNYQPKIAMSSTKLNQGRVLGAFAAAPKLQLNPVPSFDLKFPENYNINLIPKKNKNIQKINLNVASVAVLDSHSKKIIFSQGKKNPLPLASITKLATALVFLDNNPGWNTLYKLRPQDTIKGGRIYLYPGETVRVKDLFYLSLVASANTATQALVRSTGLSNDDFIKEMNLKAKTLGLIKTHFADPVGLSNDDISPAEEIIKLAKIALSDEHIKNAVLKKYYEFISLNGKKTRVYSTDFLLHSFPQNGVKIIGGKTGFTESAGYCFVGRFVNKKGREIFAIILGAKNYKSRFTEMEKLVHWIYNNYTWS